MRQFVLALSLSCGVHLLLGGCIYTTWQMNQRTKMVHTPVHSLALRYTHKEALEPALPTSPIIEPTTTSLPQKKLPTVKHESSVEKPHHKASLNQTPSSYVDNNATSSPKPALLSTTHDEAPLQPSVVPSPSKVSYIEAHHLEILQALNNAKEYPEVARKRALEGVVELSFTLRPDGEIEGIEAHSTSQILGNSAIASLQKAKYFFPKSNENVTLKVPIIYRLK